MKKVKLKKRKNKLRIRRKIVLTSTLVLLFVLGIGYASLSVNLNILGNITVKKTYGNTLYEVLEKESSIGGLAIEYTGEHHDSFTEEPSKKIYHWYANNEDEGNALATDIINKNNVIFANHCWQMIRTTDTGGVKMVYNGEPENNQCLNTRVNHIGYSSETPLSMSTTYYYGTSYTFDKTNNVFSLAGNITTGTIQTGQYTCMKTSSTRTCGTLYLVDDLDSGTTYNAIPLNGNSHYSQFGQLKFNHSNSPAYVGYMYNEVYPVYTKQTEETDILTRTRMINSTSYYYGTDVTYDSNTNQYILSGITQDTWANTYSSANGLYTCRSTTDTQCSTVYYIVGGKDDYMYGFVMTGGNLLNYYNTNIVFGRRFTESDGTYTISDTTTITKIDWYNNQNNYIYRYTCGDDTTTCTNLRYITYVYSWAYDFLSSLNNYIYANGFSYNSGTNTYTLNSDRYQSWRMMSTDINNINTHHYTCFNDTGECSSLSYVYDISTPRYSTYISYINLNNGKNIENAINEMFYNDNVNTTNSVLKTGIDAWYKRYMTEYTDYLEDTVFCNDRSQSNQSTNGWNPNGGDTTITMQFYGASGLSCPNVTDRFSVSNNKASLTYPVGLLTYPELNLLNNYNIVKTGKNYWLSSPVYFYYGYARERYVAIGGYLDSEITYYTYGVRPAISLKPDTQYVSGNGSMTDPYVVHTFQDDDWATIVNNVRNGNTDNYHVGDTKTVDMGLFGTHTLRIANKSTPSECNNSSFSQTACGFVLEFADIIERRKMNSTSTNVGGWPVTEMRTYVNNDIYNALPSDLKNGIIDTRVISGHGSSDSNNFTSTEKLYLQSVKELYDLNLYDAAANNTRQLDYYSNMGVHSADIRVARKYNTNDEIYWLRSANSTSTSSYYAIDSSGMWESDGSTIILGISPAFRIG